MGIKGLCTATCEKTLSLQIELNSMMWLHFSTFRPGKSLWEKKWVVLGNNHVYIYASDNTDEDPTEEFNLRPGNGLVSIHSAVTAAELTNTAATDLPYILRLEFEPETTCWPGRYKFSSLNHLQKCKINRERKLKDWKIDMFCLKYLRLVC